MITKEEWSEINEIFCKAAELPRAEQPLFVSKHAHGNPVILREVQALLDSMEKANHFMEKKPGEHLKSLIPMGQEKVDTPYQRGETIGDFVISKILGKGAFAIVYLAKQISLNREVALKVSKDFGEEGRTMAPLDHDNIVKVYSQSIDKSQNQKMICMQYVPGTTLEQIMIQVSHRDMGLLSGVEIFKVIDVRSDPGTLLLNPSAFRDRENLLSYDYIESVLWIGSQLADALDYAHKKGVLHLDIKPSNILVTPYGRPMLTDFNISAKSTTIQEGTPKNFGGTRDYMSPEHLLAFKSGGQPEMVKRINRCSDIFSLGVVIREMFGLTPRKKEAPAKFKHEYEEICEALDYSIEHEQTKRIQTANGFSQILRGCFELHRIKRHLPPVDFFTRFCLNSPLWGLLIFSGLPQLAGAYFAISYNSINIVSKLNPAQQELFNTLLFIYNPLVATFGIGIWLYSLLPIAKYLKKPGRYFFADQQRRVLRKTVLELPFWALVIAFICWMPGSLFFPLTIHASKGPLPNAVFGHFLVSFTLAFLIVTSYSVIVAEYLVLRFLYPKFWIGETNISQTASQELRRRWLDSKFFCSVPSIVALLGAILLLIMDTQGSDHYRQIYLAIFLIFLGMFGVSFSFLISERITATRAAIIGEARSQAKSSISIES